MDNFDVSIGVNHGRWGDASPHCFDWGDGVSFIPQKSVSVNKFFDIIIILVTIIVLSMS